MAVEGDFVADLGLFGVDPGIRGVGQHLALEVGLHVLAQRHVFRVAQGGVGHGFPFGLAFLAEDDLALLIAQRAFDGDGAVAEILVAEDAGDRHAVAGFLAKLAKQPGDVVDVGGAQFLAFAAQAFAHFLPEAGGVDELHLALAGGRLAVADDPDVGADAGVVEHVRRQGDDGLHEVVFEDVAADFAFAAAGTAGEERGTVEDDAEAAAAVAGGAHLRQQVQEEEQGAVADARQAGAEASVVALFGELLADEGLDFFPLDPEGRIGQGVVEDLAGQAVGGEGVAEDDVGDVLALDEHVRLADGVGLGVQLLAVHDQAGVRVDLGQVLAGHAEHAAGAGGGVVEAAHHARPGQGFIVLDEEQVHHQANHLARGEVLPGGLIGELGKLADQLLEHRAHPGIAHHLRVQVDVRELLGDQIEQTGLGEAVDLQVELEALEDVPHRRRKRLDVGAQVLADVVLVAHQLFQVERRGVVEELAADFEEERLGIQAGRLAFRFFRQDRRLAGFQQAVEPPQHGEGKDDLAVLRLLVVAPEQIGDGPDEGGKVGVGHGQRG